MFGSLRILSWPRVEIKRPHWGESASVVIPYVCPNCLAQGTTGWRIGHSYFLSNTTYYQTFWYCEPCRAVIRHESFTMFLRWLLGIAAAGATGALLVNAGVLEGPMVALSIFAGVAVGVVVTLLRRMGKPLPANAAGRFEAAYYTGQSLGGLGGKDVYRARRQEWLNLLVAANPSAVSDQAYSTATGQSRPAPSNQKPF